MFRTIGIAAAIIRDRAGPVVRLFTGVTELAWSIATFFVVPVLIFEERSIADSLRQSITLMKRTWGESLVGTGGLTAFTSLLIALGFAPLIAGLMAEEPSFVSTGLLLALGWWMLVTCLATALGGIYRAALYVYATEDRVPAALSQGTVAGAFKLRA